MGLIRTIELKGASILGRRYDRNTADRVERIVDLSSWMMILGTIRLTCALADYAKIYLESTRLEPFSPRMLGSFFRNNHPLVAVGPAWPLLLGLALRRTRWPELLRATAVTFLILSIGGVLEFAADWGGYLKGSLTLGSFQITRRALGSLRLPDLLLGMLGGAQLLLEFGTAIRAIQLVLRGRGLAPGEPNRQAEARRARFGRLAIYTSLAYSILMIRLPIWTTYLEVLNQSRPVREFILQNDLTRIHRPGRPMRTSAEAGRVYEMQILLDSASVAWGQQRYSQAHEAYRRLASMIEASPVERSEPGISSSAAQALNNLAWLLATCPEESLRDPEDAVRLARRAVELRSGEGNYWNTLGVSLYRKGRWEDARNALYRSMELRNEGDSFDWFFLALIHLKLGHQERAREWYTRAADRYHRDHPEDVELYRFQVEAARELGLPRPEAPPSPPPRPMRAPSRHPMPLVFPGRRLGRYPDPSQPVR